LWMIRRIWHCIKSHSRPYSTHPFNCSPLSFHHRKNYRNLTKMHCLQHKIWDWKNQIHLFNNHGFAKFDSHTKCLWENLDQDQWSRLLRSCCIEGTNKSIVRRDFSVPLMHHDPCNPWSIWSWVRSSQRNAPLIKTSKCIITWSE